MVSARKGREGLRLVSIRSQAVTQRSQQTAIQAELFASSRNPKEGMILAQRTGGHNEPEKTARGDVKEEAKGFVWSRKGLQRFI